MRLRYRRPLAAVAATLLAGVTAVVVAPPAALAATDLLVVDYEASTATASVDPSASSSPR